MRFSVKLSFLMLFFFFVFFFFSSRRRHTRSTRDWSSDVCSSDLGVAERLNNVSRQPLETVDVPPGRLPGAKIFGELIRGFRSEERRVGKECRCMLSPVY